MIGLRRAPRPTLAAMDRPAPARPAAGLVAVLALALACAGFLGAPGQARAQDEPARQVTLFGIIAMPGTTAIDPKLARVAPQLRKLLPGHGFKLLGVQSRRLAVGQSLSCDLGAGYSAEARLDSARNPDGKVELRVAFEEAGAVLAVTDVSTPPNQLFFCDKLLPDASRLVVGVGAR